MSNDTSSGVVLRDRRRQFPAANASSTPQDGPLKFRPELRLRRKHAPTPRELALASSIPIALYSPKFKFVRRRSRPELLAEDLYVSFAARARAVEQPFGYTDKE
jgi:hypothetical protein